MTLEQEKIVTIETNFDLTASSKTDAIDQLVTQLVQDDIVSDHDKFMKDVFTREDELPTYIGYGIGLPHSQSTYVKRAAVMIGRLKQPITWHEQDQAQLIFLIAVPKTAQNNLHLKILANLSRLLMHEDFREQLLTADEATVQQLIYQKMTY